MSIVEIIEVVILLIIYFAGGFAVWDDVIDWKDAGLKEILLLIFWFPVIFTLLIVFITQEIFSFVMKKVRKTRQTTKQKAKSYKGVRLIDSNRITVYFNKHNFGLGIFVDRPAFLIQLAFFSIFVHRELKG
jgi:uncharacterized membrane-anchored protein YitT (DUF2179 family)